MKKGEKMTDVEVEPVSKVVSAIGTASGGEKAMSAYRIQQVMADASAKAMSEGITDPDEIRKRVLAAREDYKKSLR